MSAPFKLGYYQPDMYNLTALEAVEAQAGRKADYRVLFVGWGEPWPTDACAALIARGTTPIVTLEPWVLDAEGNFVSAPSLTELANGTEDATITAFAEGAAGHGADIIVRFAHEMNNNGYPWGCGPSNTYAPTNTPAQYIAAWRNFHDVFEASAPEALLLWCPNRNGPNPNVTPAESWSSSYADQFWPGAAYVDYVGFDAYNSDGDWGTPWNTPAGLFDDIYSEVTGLSSAPLIICETGSRSYTGNKATWVHLLFPWARTHAIEGLCWFNSPSSKDTLGDGNSWEIDVSGVASDDPLTAWQQQVAILDRPAYVVDVPCSWAGNLVANYATWADTRSATTANHGVTGGDGSDLNPWGRTISSVGGFTDGFALYRTAMVFSPTFTGHLGVPPVLSVKCKYHMGDNGVVDADPGGTVDHIVGTTITDTPIAADFDAFGSTVLAELPAMPGWGWKARALDIDITSGATFALGVLCDDDVTDSEPTTEWTRFTAWYGDGDADAPYLTLTVLLPQAKRTPQLVACGGPVLLGVIRPQDGSAPVVFEAGDARMSWDTHGPLLLDAEIPLSELDVSRVRLGRVTVDGMYGRCWEGYITTARRSGIEASGPDYGLALGQSLPRLFADTNISEYRERTYGGRDTRINAGMNGDALVLSASAGTTFSGGEYNGMFRVYPVQMSDAYLLTGWMRRSASYTVKVSWGISSGNTDGYEVVSWLGDDVFETGAGGTTGTATTHITDTFDVLCFQVIYDGAGGTLPSSETLATFDPTLYGVTGIANGDATPEQVIAYAHGLAPSWLAGADAGVYAAGLGAEIVPLVLDNATPLDIARDAERYQACRVMWRPYRTATASGYRPVLDAQPSTPAYMVDLRDPQVTYEGFGGLTVDGLANRVEVGYERRDGVRKTRTLSASASNYLDDIGAEQWSELDIGRSAAAVADRIGQVAVDDASVEHHAGTITTPTIRTISGTLVPVESVLCGERVLVVGLQRQITPRLMELNVQSGMAQLTLDSARNRLESQLARFEAARNKKGGY